MDSLIVVAKDRICQTPVPQSNVKSESALDLESQVSVVDQVTDDDELACRAIEFLLYPPFANYVEALYRIRKAARRDPSGPVG